MLLMDARDTSTSDFGPGTDTGISTTRGDFVAELYRLHGTALRRFVALVNGGDRMLAEDVVQETLLRAWLNYADLKDRRPVRAWLFAVARRIVIDQWRRRNARPREVHVASQEAVGATGDPDDSLSALVVADALRALSKAHRDVIVQVYYLGHTTRSAAEILRIPPGTVRSRLYYAMASLRSALSDRGFTYRDE